MIKLLISLNQSRMQFIAWSIINNSQVAEKRKANEHYKGFSELINKGFEDKLLKFDANGNIEILNTAFDPIQQSKFATYYYHCRSTLLPYKFAEVKNAKVFEKCLDKAIHELKK